MQLNSNRPADTYVPLYFLSSVGAGGLTATFFMYLLFWVPHTGRPVPIFEDITAAFSAGPFATQFTIIIAMIGIAGFATLNIKSLIWNLREFSKFKKTERFETLRSSNAEATILAMPLALAMSVNALFIVGLVFVPQLWTVIEFLFPLAMVAFLAIGYIALSNIAAFLGRILSTGRQFDLTGHNSFAQLMPAFATAMIAVGLSAPAAMSTNTTVVGLSLIASTFFAIITIVYAFIALITAFNSILQHGVAKEAGPTIMIIIPLMTILGILFLRQDHGLHTTFDGHTGNGEMLIFLTRIIAIQFAFLGLGLLVLKRQDYFKDFVFGNKTSPGSYALACPGIALSVMLQFFVNKGLVASGLVDKFSTTYWALTTVALLFQFAMVWLVLRLNRQHFSKPTQLSAVPAE